jgi:hypothetical protein
MALDRLARGDGGCYSAGRIKHMGSTGDRGEAPMQFAVGFKLQGKSGHALVDGEDALIAALKVKMERPEAEIMYVRRANRRGDTRHPAHAMASERR